MSAPHQGGAPPCGSRSSRACSTAPRRLSGPPCRSCAPPQLCLEVLPGAVPPYLDVLHDHIDVVGGLYHFVQANDVGVHEEAQNFDFTPHCSGAGGRQGDGARLEGSAECRRAGEGCQLQAAAAWQQAGGQAACSCGASRMRREAGDSQHRATTPSPCRPLQRALHATSPSLTCRLLLALLPQPVLPHRPLLPSHPLQGPPPPPPPPGERTLLLHVHLLDFLAVQDFDRHLVPRQNVLRHLDLQRNGDRGGSGGAVGSRRRRRCSPTPPWRGGRRCLRPP